MDMEKKLNEPTSTKRVSIYRFANSPQFSRTHSSVSIGGYEHDETPTIDSDPNSPICLEPNSTDCTPRAPLDLPLSRKVYIDGSVTLADEHEPKVRSGVVFGQGDGTVSLLSLGSMCVEGWQVSLFSLHCERHEDRDESYDAGVWRTCLGKLLENLAH